MSATHTALPYFLYATGILYREGLEAMLVVVALAAGTRHSSRLGHAREIYGGAVAAIAASVALAWAVNHFIGDDASDTLEGVFQLLATATLFYVSSWLTSKSQAERWLGFISHKVERARQSSVPAMALGLTAFLAVIREGAETIVFFEALTAGATEAVERHAVAAGIFVAVLALAVTFFLLTRAAHRIPIGPFFSLTSILLYALAVVFIGQGLASLQEAGVVGATFVEHVPTVPTLGLFPTAQTLLAQAVLLVLAAAAIVAPRTRAAALRVAESVTPDAGTRPT
jgi:high-affinity iron transporter